MRSGLGGVGVLEDIPEADVISKPEDEPMNDADAKAVRPIQMGEFLRKYVSRRLLMLSATGIAKLMTAARQLGVGTPGGTEALALFHQFIFEDWASGGLPNPLARIKIDEKNCFGRLEWRAIRESSRRLLPRHYAPACWKQSRSSYVEQPGVGSMPKDRGAEQGDVDGPLECSLVLAQVAGAARLDLAAKQRSGSLPWFSTEDNTNEAAIQDFDHRSVRARSFEEEAHENTEVRLDPRLELQKNGGLADFWYLDDGDIMCDPSMVLPFLDAFDSQNVLVGAERNMTKTQVIYYATPDLLASRAHEWRLDDVKSKASISCAADGVLTLGVMTGPAVSVTSQLEQKTKVVRAMHERVKLCHDSQTEFVLARESLGVGRVNHILRVHGHALVEESGSATEFDEVGRETLERLFPGITSEGYIQASLNDKKGGVGWRQAIDVARPAHLGALIAAAPRLKAMFQDCQCAGLFNASPLEERLARRIGDAETAFLECLDEIEKVMAEDFLRKAKESAEETWRHTALGLTERIPVAPRVSREGGEYEEADGSPARGTKLTAPHLQRELSMLMDRTKARRLKALLQSLGAWQQLDRFTDLGHHEVSHRWLRHLDPARGGVLAAADFVINVQKRLGNRMYNGEAPCRVCGAFLDAHLQHSETCSTAEATRGHYACVRALVNGLQLADPAITTEPRGLTTSASRPADVFTTAAVPGRGAALDVCVASPNAAAAMGDAAATAFRRKRNHYRNEIAELSAAGIAFRPMIWTADGRPHPAVTRTLHFAAQLAVTRNNQQATAESLVSRWKHEIQIAILRRRAAMTRAVLPGCTARQMWLLAGQADRCEQDGRALLREEDDAFLDAAEVT